MELSITTRLLRPFARQQSTVTPFSLSLSSTPWVGVSTILYKEGPGRGRGDGHRPGGGGFMVAQKVVRPFARYG